MVKHTMMPIHPFDKPKKIQYNNQKIIVKEENPKHTFIYEIPILDFFVALCL